MKIQEKIGGGSSTLRLALVGLPNAGASTFFNALTLQRRSASPFLGETRSAASGIMSLDDTYFERLCEVYRPQRRRPLELRLFESPSLLSGQRKVLKNDLVIYVVRAFEGEKVTHFGRKVDPNKDLQLLASPEPSIVLINGHERHFLLGQKRKDVVEVANDLGIRHVVFASAAFEERLQSLREKGQLEDYLDAHPTHHSAKDAILSATFAELDLITVYTCSDDEVRAYAIRDGTTVMDFANIVHELIARNFLLAEIAHFNDFFLLHENNNNYSFLEAEARRQKKVQRCGPKVILEDRQLVFFHFKV